jgi:hypothetical protein
MYTQVLANYNNGMTVEIIDLEVTIVGSHWKVKPALPAGHHNKDQLESTSGGDDRLLSLCSGIAWC